MKVALRLLIVLSVFLSTIETFARAGGGRSGGGGGGYGGGFGGGYYYHGHYYPGNSAFDPVVTTVVIIITIVFFSIAIFGIAWLMLLKSRAAKRELKKAESLDPFWNEEDICKHARDICLKMQEAWGKNDLTEIEHLLTRDFFIHYQHFLSRYTKMGMKNVMKDVVITKTQIVKVIDKDIDNQDTVVVYINGNMIDYLVSTQTGAVLDGDRYKSFSFEDIYVFFRRNNQWLLNQIINDPNSKFMKAVRENIG